MQQNESHEGTPHRGRPRRWLKGAMAILAVTAAQAAWADLDITTTKEYDGTGTCTLDTDP